LREVYTTAFSEKVRRLRARGKKSELGALKMTVRAIRRRPDDHDGEQPGLGIAGAVRKKVLGTGYRIIYAVREPDDSFSEDVLEFLDIYTVPQLGFDVAGRHRKGPVSASVQPLSSQWNG
jgi:hypothetical protein